MADDSSTLTLGPLDTLTGSARGLPAVPALTILWHPDLDRVGDVAPLTGFLESDVVELNREAPIFFTPGSSVGRAIDHRAMSLDNPPLRFASTRGRLELRPGSGTTQVEVDGEPFTRSREVDASALRRGVVITVGRGFVFCLHTVHYPISRSPAMGLLGSSDAIEDVRRAITRTPDDKTLVLIRGESGTGKELAAKALHSTGARSTGPFISVNTGALRSETAAAALFGHEKGAFTGATDAQPGYFREAHGGTLFLDEIGLMPYDVQASLLRVLEDQTVHSLGTSRPRKVDVRVIAATDVALEQAVKSGRFLPSLHNRLTNGYPISLPPLRDRRPDVGLLLVAFLRQQFGGAGELQRIQWSGADGRGWLSSRAIASIALSHLPGNVRDLEGLARALRTCSGPGARDTRTVIAERLAVLEELAPASDGQASSKAKGPRDLAGALEASRWNRQRAMKVLNVSKATFYRLLGREPDVARLLHLSEQDLLRDLRACDGDLSRLAAKLQLPEDLVARRLGDRR